MDILAAGHDAAYHDGLETEDGRMYKVMGDLHPADGLLALLEYVPWPNGRRQGYEKTYDYAIPDVGQSITPAYPQYYIPLYGHAFEIVPLSAVHQHFRPEPTAQDIARRSTPEQMIVDDFLAAFSTASGVDRNDLGVNGSWMLKIATDASNVNIDVFGAQPSIQALSFVSSLGRTGGRDGFYPPDPARGRNTAHLRSLCRDAFGGISETEAYRILREEGRLCFSGFYQTLPFTIHIHTWRRGQDHRRLSQHGWRFNRRTIVEAEVTDSAGLLQYHSPGPLGLRNVFDCLLKANLDVTELMTLSKRFWYTRPGDRIRFRADVIDTPGGARLAVPDSGKQWLFEFVHRHVVPGLTIPSSAAAQPAPRQVRSRSGQHRILVIANRMTIMEYLFHEIQTRGDELVAVVTQSPHQKPRLRPEATYLPDIDPTTVSDLAQKWKVTTAIYASTNSRTEALRASAQLSQYLNDLDIPIIAHPFEVLERTINKAECQTFLRQQAIAVPRSMLARGYQQVADAARALGLPVILKLLDRSGGIGTCIVHDEGELARIAHDSSGFLPNEFYLVEEFIEGTEYSVEVLIDQGMIVPLAIIHKGRTDARHPLERPRIAPWSGPEAEAVRELAVRAVRALGGRGVMEFDIVVGSNGPMVLEVNPRLGGVTFMGIALGGLTSPRGLLEMAVGSWPAVATTPPRWDNVVAEIPFSSSLTPDEIFKLRCHPIVYNLSFRQFRYSNGNMTLAAPSAGQILQFLDEAVRMNLNFLDLDVLRTNLQLLEKAPRNSLLYTVDGGL